MFQVKEKEYRRLPEGTFGRVVRRFLGSGGTYRHWLFPPTQPVNVTRPPLLWRTGIAAAL